MKKKTHPKYYKEVQVSCTCGASFKTGATVPEIKASICSECHPFFTGKSKFIDTKGRLERFQEKREKAKKNPVVKKVRKKKKKK